MKSRIIKKDKKNGEMICKKVKLGDVCRIEKGTTGILKAIPGEYPMVVTGEDRKSHNEYQFDDDAVVIPLVSGTGHGHASIKRIHYQSGKFALGSILCAVIPKDKNQLSAEYLYRFLDLNKENELVARMKGMANVTLPIKEIVQIEIPLPSLTEQFNFVENYKVLEGHSRELAAELNHQLDLLKKLRQQLLQDAVQGKLLPQDKNDEPANKLLKTIKAEKAKEKKSKEHSPIKPEEVPFDIPENWVWCRLGEICEYNPRNKANDNLEVAFIPMPLISAHFNKLPEFTVRKWKDIKSGFTHFADNDVIVAKITPCFENSKAGIVKNLPNGIGAGTTELYVIRGNFGVIPEYIYTLIKTSDFLRDGEKIMGGVSGQQRVPSEYVYNLPFPLPPVAEQQRIVTKLEGLMYTFDEMEVSIQDSRVKNEQLLQQVLREALKAE